MEWAEPSNYSPCYLLWALDCLGHPAAAVLDGGFKLWPQRQRPPTKDYPSIKKRSYRLPLKFDSRVRMGWQAALAASKTDTPLLVNARSAGLYTGRAGAWKRVGHLPGAVNPFWLEDTTAGGTWKPVSELRASSAAQGITPDKPVIVYCGRGLMSSHVHVTLKYLLGFKHVANNDGSWSDWSIRPELPVQQGPRP